MNKVKGTNEYHMQFEREEERIATNKKMNRDVDFDRPKWRDINFIKGFLFTCIAFLLIPSLSHGQKTNPQILILNSYHQGFEWSDNELSGLMGRLRQECPTIDAYIEHLDAKRFPIDDHLLRMKDYLIDKHRGRKIDLVITLDDPALEFALRHRDRLFPKVPIVFAGINNFNPDMLKGQEKVTGVAEFQDIAGTLKVALKLHPYCKEVLAIHDYISSGLATRQAMESLLPEFQSRVNIRFTPPATVNEVLDQLKSLPPDSLAIILSFATDSAGKSLPLDESTRLFTSIPSVPVYSLNEPRIGHGIVGGILVSGEEQGKRAGDMALRVLSGEDPSTIPVDTRNSSLPEFDYHQLVKFHIPLKSLPKGSIIINRPESFYEKYRDLVLGTLAVVLTLTLVVALLTWTIIRRRQAEESLRESEEKYKTLTETSQTGIYIFQDEIIVYANNRFAELHGYTVQELLGTDYFELFDPIERERARETAKRLGSKAAPRVHEIKRIRKDGSTLWCLTEVVRIEYQGKPAIMGNLADITQRKKAEKALSALNAVSQTVNRSLSLDEVMNDTLDKVMELFKPHSTYIRLLDTETQELVFAVQKGLSPAELKLVTHRLKQENGLADFAIKSGKAVVVEDVLTDPRTANRQIFASKIGCRTLVTLPLYAKNEVVGTMSVRMREPHAYADEEIRLFTAIGYQVGIAIENARLYQQARNTVRELRESQAEREKIIVKLQEALAEVKTLGELLPICSHCKNIRDDKGYWSRIEAYIHKHSGTEFSHGICPECAKKYYPDMDLYSDEQTQ